MPFQLQFDTKSTGPEALDQIAKIIAQIGKNTTATSGELKGLQVVLEAEVKAGRSLESVLRDASRASKEFSAAIRDQLKEIANSEAATKRAQAEIQRYGSTQARAEQEDRRRTESLKRLAEAQNRAAELEEKAQRARQFGAIRGAAGLASVAGVGIPGAGTAISGVSGLLGAGLSASTVVVGGAALAIGLAGKAALDAAAEVGKYARAMTDLAERTGLSTREAQLFTRSAEVVGVRGEALVATMRTLSRGLAEGGEEGRKQKAALDQLGVTSQDAFGKLLPVGQIIQSIGEKLRALPTGPEKDFFANTILGRGGLELIPAIERLKELGSAVSATGVIMDTEGVRAAAHYQEQLTLLGDRWTAIKQIFGQKVIGVIEVSVPNLLDPSKPKSAFEKFLSFESKAARTIYGGLYDHSIIPQILNLPSEVRGAKSILGGDTLGPLDAENVLRKSQSGFLSSLANPAADAEAMRSNFAAIHSGGRQTVEELKRAQSKAKARADKLIEARERAASTGDFRGALLSAGESQAAINRTPAGQLGALLNKSTSQAVADEERAAKAVKAREEAEHNVKKASEETLRLREEILKLQAKESQGSAKIIGEYTAEIQKLKDKKELTAENARLVGVERDLKLQKLAEDDRFRFESSLNKESNALRVLPGLIGPENPRDRVIAGFAQSFAKDQLEREFADFALRQANPQTGLLQRPQREIDADVLRRQDLPGLGRVDPNALGRVQRESKFQEQFIKLTDQPGERMAEIERSAKIRLNAAQEEFRITLDLGKLEADQDDAKKQRLLDYLSARKQGEEQYVSAVQASFRGLISGGGGGLGAALKSQLLGTFDQVAGNAARITYDSVGGKLAPGGQVGPDGKPTVLGKLLSGTLFGKDTNDIQKKALAIEKGNADATVKLVTSQDRLRVSVDELAKAFKSGGVSGGTADGAFGAAGVLSSIGSVTGSGGASAAIGAAGGALIGGAGSSGGGSPYTGISGALGGLGHTGDLQGIFTGVGAHETLTTSERIGGALGTAALLYGVERGIAAGVREGGAKGFSGAAAAGLGGAAAIAGGPTNPVGIGLTIAAATAGLVSSLLPDRKAERAHEIAKEIDSSRYQAPISQNRTQDIYGHYADTDAYGRFRSSNLSSIPQITEPSQFRRDGVYYNVPGRTDSPYGGGTQQPVNVTYNINALDAVSFEGYVHRHPNAAATLVNVALTKSTAAHGAVRDVANGFS